MTGSDVAIFFIVLDFLDDIASKPFPVLALATKNEVTLDQREVSVVITNRLPCDFHEKLRLVSFFHDWIAEMP